MKRPFFDPSSEVVWFRVLFVSNRKEAFRVMEQTTFILPIGETVVGRSDSSDIAIPENTVSRRHCILHLDSGALRVTDADSLHGVRVNGTLLKQHTIRSRADVSLIQLGQSLCAVEVRKMNEPLPQLCEVNPALPADAAEGDVHPGAQTRLLQNHSIAQLHAVASALSTHETRLDASLSREKSAMATRARMRCGAHVTGPMRRTVE